MTKQQNEVLLEMRAMCENVLSNNSWLTDRHSFIFSPSRKAEYEFELRKLLNSFLMIGQDVIRIPVSISESCHPNALYLVNLDCVVQDSVLDSIGRTTMVIRDRTELPEKLFFPFNKAGMVRGIKYLSAEGNE